MRLRRLVAVLLVLCMALGIMPTALASGTERFTDFPTGWSAPAMTAAVQNGLLVGVSDTEIKPEDNLTRAEFATIIARAFGAETVADISNFTDVSPSEWYYNYIAKAVKMEVLKGKSDSQMDPDAFITREEVFTALARVLVLSSDDSSSLNRFHDSASISDWAIPELSEMSARGYVNGDETGNLTPKANITREEFAQVMYNTIKTYITTTGVYGGTLEGITVVRTGNVTLRDASVTGDLVIGDGAGVGAVKIENTNIQGRLLVRGGTMTLKNFKIGQDLVVVKNVNGVTNFNNYRSEFKEVIELTPAKFLTKGGSIGTGSSGPGGTLSYYITIMNPSGIQPQVITVARGQVPNLSSYVVPNGYSHSGRFYLDAAKTRPYNLGPVTTNLILYPDLTPITYTITYNLPAGTTLDGTEVTSYTVETPSITLPTAANLTITDPTKQFKGWYKDAGYTDGPYLTLNPQDCTNVTLYAKVSGPEEVDVYFRKNLGDTTNYASYTIQKNSSLTTMPADPPADTGYQFAGWYIDGAFNDESKKVTLSTTFSADTYVYAKFTPIPYTISYELPAGSSLNITPTTSYDITQSVTLPVSTNVTVPFGYEFGGWYDNAGFTGSAVTEIAVGTTGNKTFYGKVTPVPYTISYVLPAGSSLDGTETLAYDITTAVTLPVESNVTVPFGYEFGGWYDNAGFTGSAVTSIAVGTTGNKTFYAKVTPIPYTINYVLPAGSSLDGTETIAYDITTAVTLPVESNVTVPFGYEFGGWYDNAGFTGSAVTSIAVGTTGNKTYYGKVTPISYSINYVMPAGSSLDGTQTLAYDITTAVTLPTEANVTVLQGFRFEGWYEDAGYTTQKVTEIPVGTTGNKTYYAKIEIINYSIDYVLPAVARLDGTETREYTIADRVIFPTSANVIVDDGYEFKGWYDSQEFNPPALTGLAIGATGNRTYYAKVVPISYSINYVLPQGTTLNGSESLSFDVLTEVMLPTSSAVSTPSGYEFLGWYDNPAFDGNAITSIPLGSTGNKTFYARVEIITYSIDYVLPQGSTLDGTETIEYNIETGVTLPTATNISVPTGYEFLGWYDNAELTGNVVTEIPVGTMGNKTFYAKVTAVPYTISYVLPAGSSLDGSQTTQYKVTMGVILPTSSAITTPLGYQFLGWYENPEFSGQAVTEIAIGTTGNKTYYGKVEIITYSIDYVLPSGSALDGTEATEYNIETAVTLPAYSTVSLPAGYVFGGWFEDAECQGQEVTEIPVGTMGNKTYYGKVTPIPYSISYVLPQGTTFKTAPVDSYNVETAVTLPTDSALTTPLGYEFLGWYENQEYSGNPVTSISTGNTGNKTFYALVKPIQYSISYELPTGSSLNITPTTSYNITLSVTLPVTENVTVPLGYEFLGWYDNDQYTGTPVTNIEVGTTGNKTFYAKVGPIPYFIYYSFPDGGSFIDPDDYVGTYTIEQMVTLPTGGVMILPRGYKFDGWKEVPVQPGMQMRMMLLANFMSDDDLVTTIEKGTTGHKAYEAQISLIEYNIRYHYPNGTALDGNETTIFTILDTVTLPTALSGIPNGYEFRGWYENDQYTGSKITGFVAEQLADSELKDKEYYAWVAPEEYDIEYVMPKVPAGVTLDGSETKKYTIETAVTLPVAENVRMPKGYKFEGWFENPEFTGTAVTGFDKGQTGKKTYYALVTAIEYSIEYDFDACGVQGVAFKDGVTPTDSYIVTDTVTLPVADDITIPDGYKFTGWYYNSTLTDGPVEEFTGKVPATGTVLTLYARVIPVDEYTVYFRLETEDTQNYAMRVVRENESLGDKMPDDPEKVGSVFGGWYIDGKFTDETKKFDGSTVVTGDTYVYAKWDGQLYTVRFIQGASILKTVEDIPYNTKLDDASYWSGLPEPPKETIYMKLSSYSDFVYYDDTPFQVADVYYYQKDNGEWARFDETVAVTKNIDAYLMDKRFSMTVKIPSRSTPFGPDTPYVPGETRMMDSLKSILENGSEVLNILEDTDTFKKAENKLTQQLIDKDIVVKHANGDLEIKITEVPVNITRFVSADRVKAVIKQYITDMVNDPAKLDSMLNMIDIDTLVNQIGTSTLVGKLTDAKIVELMKKEENRTTVINGVYSALGNEAMQSVIISYLTERIESDEVFCNTIAEEFKTELASDPTLRAEILGDTTLLNSVLGQANMKALVADMILGDDVLEIAVSDPTFKSTLIEKMAGNATVREKVSQTTLFTSYVLTKIKADDTLKDKIREKLATDASLRETIITNSDLLNLFLDDSTLKSTIISSAVDNDLFISKIISNDGLKEIIINNMSDNKDFVDLLLHTEAFADFVVTALHDQNSPFKTHVLELLEEDSVKADMHEIIKANDGFRAELASDELKGQVMDAIDEYISHGNIDDLVAYIWHRTLGDAYTGGREADYENFITDEMVDEFKDILYDHRPDEAISYTSQEFFDYLTSNADARDDVKASADADVRAKINTELTQYKEDVLADFIDDGVITNPDGTENLDIESKIDDAILEIIKNYIITETTGNADADAHIEHEMVEYTKDIVLNEPDDLHQDLVSHIEDIKKDFKASIIDIDNDILVQSIIDFRDDSQDNKTILTGVINDNFVSITDYIKQNVAGDNDLKGTISDMIAEFADDLSNDLINSLIEKIGDGHSVISTIVAEYIDGLTADELKAEINAFVGATSDADILDMVQELRDDTTLGLKGIIQGDDIYSEIQGYLVDNIGNGTISSKVDNVLATKASSIDTAVISDLIIKLLGNAENSGMVTNYLTRYISNSEKETTVKGYINGFIESDSLNEQFIRENRKLIEDIINSIDISGMITNELVKDYIDGLTPAEKQEFISDVYGAVLELDYVEEFIYAFETKADSFEINKDNLAFVKAIADSVDAFTYDTVIQYISFKGFDRIEQLLGDRFLEPLFNKAKADYVTRLNDAIAQVEADNTKVVDYSTSMIFKVDIINDVLAKLYEKATEETVERLNKVDGIRYNENDYLYSLIEYKDLLREDLLERSTHGSDPELTGWMLRTPTEYYDAALGKVILLDDAICWYGDNLTEQQIDAIVSAALGRGFDVHDKINEIISDYDLYRELPDSVQSVIDRVSKLNSFITKYQNQIDAMVDKYLSSGLNQKFEEDDVMNKDKVDKMIDIIFGTEDEPIFNIDTVYLLLDKANVELRGKVHQKLLDNETRVQNAIEKFENTDIGALLSGIGNSKVTSAAEKAQEFLTTGKIRSAYDNIYDILLHITDPEIGPDAYSFTVDDPTIKGVDDAYKFSIRGIEFKFMRYYK